MDDKQSFSQGKVNIEIDTNLINEIKKGLSENWGSLLTKLEQQLVKVLYLENSALNIYQIRQILIFSTAYHMAEPFLLYKKGDSKNLDKKIDKQLEKYELNKFKEYPCLQFSLDQADEFFNMFNNLDLKNKKTTEKESIIMEEFKKLGIEIYGFKTIMDSLENLKLMKIILSRELNKGKSKIIYSINPLLKKYIKDQEF